MRRLGLSELNLVFVVQRDVFFDLASFLRRLHTILLGRLFQTQQELVSLLVLLLARPIVADTVLLVRVRVLLGVEDFPAVGLLVVRSCF